MPAAEQPDPSFSATELNLLFDFATSASHVAIAVSGGSDSTALMLLASQWRAQSSSPAELTVLTVDHGLRPESAEETRCVLQWAKDLGLRAEVIRWEGNKPRTGIQVAAREARYRLMSKWCHEHRASILVTAHTLEDQAETMMMRLARGTGIEGLGGMVEQRELHGLTLARPLLAVSRDRLRALLVSHGHPWVDDPSNANPAFERIRLRQALSALAQNGIDAAAFAETARRARRASDAIVWAALEFLEKHHIQHPAAYGEVDLKAFIKLPSDIRIRTLGMLIIFYGPGAKAELAALERLESWFSTDGPVGKKATLGGCQIAVRKASFLVGREPGRIDKTPLPLTPNQRMIWDGRFEILVNDPGLIVVPAAARADQARNPELPAFVQAGLPLICDDHRAVWGFGQNDPAPTGISVRFLKKD